MNSITIIGWAYEADYHCNECAAKRFPVYRVSASGVELEGVDNEGNEIVPVFYENARGDEYCGDCHRLLY